MTSTTWRDIHEGAVAGMAVAAAYSAAWAIGQLIPEPAARAAPLTQAEIARKVRSLAEELSLLLGELDDGRWELRISPPFHGCPMYSVDPVNLPPQTRLGRGVERTRAALEELRPGAWRVECRLEEAIDAGKRPSERARAVSAAAGASD